MTDAIVEELIRAWVTVVAIKLKIPNAFNLNVYGSIQNVLNTVYAQDPDIGAALINAKAAYEQWWNVNKQAYTTALTALEHEQLRVSIIQRDSSRDALLELLKVYQ